MWTVSDVMKIMEARYPQRLQESWDKNGLIVGDPDQRVSRILLAVDPVAETVAQAIEDGYDMLITHHPLYLRGTSFVSRLDYKGRIVHDLIKSDVALMNAHTNADSAARGVAWALAQAVGIEGEPFDPIDEDEAGTARGLGRIGKLEAPQTLREFADRVAKALPAGPHGIFVGAPGNDLETSVSTVAVSGGSGDSFLARARELGADVYVTADLRHHPASEHLEEGGPALICGSHWATEWLWLPHLADDLEEAAADAGVQLQVDVSRFVTEPWNLHLETLG
ncbi:Nif3-like dinuclear metal center hexameric protein [Gleimia europaea]|nr:Nif3-like dinuclear metal center hexameric protein [Gleimia europaea]MDK8533782.1 Nif3-like dinuclear metal center hexameric protein [Gleimia europaea]